VRELQKAPAAVRFLSIEPLLEDLGSLDMTGIDWVIVGGESGPGARLLAAEWVRSLRAQCKKQRVRFFFKQWGGVQKKKNGRLLDGKTYDEFPLINRSPVPTKAVRNEYVMRYSPETITSLVEIAL
jgi:protein gp37